MIQIELRLFGAFKDLGNGGNILLELPEGAGLSDLRKAFSAKISECDSGFRDVSLVQDSAFADEDEILGESTVIRAGAKLCVLPPVCGG
ncbi:MAG: MoaD/ThiS family protein [Bdellovibrionota bacterium]